MKKFSIVAIGIVFLLAGLYAPVFADSGDGSSPGKAGTAKMNSLSNLSMAYDDHIVEIFTATNSDNGYADKYFNAGTYIYFYVSTYLMAPGPITVYTIVSNAAGKVVVFHTHDFTAPLGYHDYWYSTNTLPSGVYNFTSFIATNYVSLVSPTAFTFIVEGAGI